MPVTFYYDLLSGPARAVYWVLAENNLLDQVELVYVDLLAKKQLDPEFLAINPYHTVPTLVDSENGVTLYESCAIGQYLSERFDLKNITIPASGPARWKAINYLHFHHGKVKTFSRGSYGRIRALFAPGTPIDNEIVRAQIATGKDWLPAFDKQFVENGGYIAGNFPTIADIFAYTELGRLRTTDYGVDIYNFKPYPNIVAWIEKMEALPQFKKSNEKMLTIATKSRELGPSSCADEE